jgi:PAS domain S-box-containing protein
MSRTRTGPFPRAAAQLLVGLGALALVTAVCFQLGLDTAPTAFLYLIVIVLLSLEGSFIPLVALSIVAVACLNYFFGATVFSFRIENPLDAVELSAFLITALVTSRLVNRSRQAEQLLAERARLLDLTHDTVFVRDMQDVITYWNRGAEELYGWTSEQAVRRVTHQLLQTRFPEPLANIMTQLLRTGRWEGELVHMKRDGTHVVVASRWSLQHDERGNAVGILETNNDISERKRAEETVQRQANLLEQTHDAIIVWEFPGKIIYWNSGAQQLYGFSKEEAIGRGTHDLLRTEHPMPADAFEAILERERIWIGELKHMTRDGRTVIVDSRHVLVDMVDGAHRRLVLETNRDITERKRADEALETAQATLAHVTRVTTLGEVTASLAHELNQPLAAIANNASACFGLLPSGRDDLDEMRDALSDIVADAERASAIIERVRELARRAPPARALLQFGGVVDDVVALAAAESRARRVAIRTDVAADLPVILGDRVQLQQVLLNLVVNGMDAMSAVEGERVLEIRGRPDSHEGGPAVRISVQDGGIGLDPGQLEQLFDAFYTTKPHGMGMGLTISRSIINAHGGRLWAESNPGSGATFSFSLPAAAEAS